VAGQNIGKLRETEAELAWGKTLPEVVRKPGVTEQTYCLWERQHGGLQWLNPAAPVAGLNGPHSDEAPRASHGVSPSLS
jgi:hypothetical protein